MTPLEVPDEIRDLLYACRVESDLARPEMSPLRTWLAESPRHREVLVATQATDRQIKHALIDLAVPAGLDAKILRSMDSADANLVSFDTGIFTSATSANYAAPSVGRKITNGAHSKRFLTWTAGIAIAGLAAAVLLIMSFSGQGSPVNQTLSARELCEASLLWIQLADNGAGPVGVENTEGHLIVPKGKRWKQLHTENGTVDCLMTSTTGGIRVFRFQLPANRGFQLPSEFSATPDLPNQKFACSARRQGDTIEVIAVEGGASNYRLVVKN